MVDTRTYVEEADENDNPIDDTKTYVSGPEHTSLKEEANVSRTRRDKQRLKRSNSSSPNTMHTDSDSTAHPASPLRRESRPQRPKDKGREKTREKRLSVPQAARPSMKGSKTMPAIQTSSSTRKQQQQQQEDPSYYGISPNAPAPIAVPASLHGRSRSYTVHPNQRHSGYYAPSASKPPLANAKYWPAPSPMLGTSFPPQAPFHPMPSPSPYHSPFMPPPPQGVPPQAMPPPPPPQDYFGHVSRDPRDILIARFDANRPRSAMARQFAPPPAIAYGNEYDDDLEDGGVSLERRSSLRKRSSRREEDRIRMPPPPQRPSTSRPMSTGGPFGPPPPSRSNRHSIGSVGSLGYDEDSLDDESSYQDTSPPGGYDYRPYPVRRPSVDSTAMYDGGPRYLEMAGHLVRRNSQYGARNRSAERGMEDQMRIARQYQEAVDGPTEPLTLDSLRKINKTPSRGTKSTGSREESGYGLRSAATTRTSLEEDITILVKGTASLNIGNTHLNVKEGTEIRIPTNPGGDRESRGGSDNVSTVYEEPRGPRFERPAARNRAASRAASRSRRQSYQGQQHPFQPQHDYGVAPPHPYHEPQMPMPYAPPSGYSYPTQF